MKNFKRFLALALATATVATMAAGCGAKNSPASAAESAAPAPASSEAAAASSAASAAETKQAGGELYYLNFKPEIADVYTKIGEEYKKETGVTLKVVTAASGTYEQVLRSELAKSDPPVLFQINGPKGYGNWQDYCKDLKNTELYKHLTDKSMAVTSGDGVYGIPYLVEGYGIIYNNAVMSKYFALDGAKAKSMDEIKGFAKLKEVVEDMTAKKDKLGIKGVFASTSLRPGDDWRWQTHLLDLPLFYEFRDNKTDLKDVNATNEIKFQYSDNYKNIFDLYLQNSTIDPKKTGTKIVDESMAEFALGRCAMVQNGNWAWSQISGTKGNTVKEEDIKFLPIYTGMPGEEKQSICVGTENNFCVNSKVSPEKQKLAEDFIYWLYSSEKGKAFVKNDLKFIAPFDTFSETERPTDPLAKEVIRYMSNADLYNVSWNASQMIPNQPYKNGLGAALLKYAQGTMKWDDLKKFAVDSWKTENAKNKTAAK